MKRKTKKNKSIFFRIAVLGVCIYMLSTLFGLYNSLNEKISELDSLKSEYASEKNDIEELKKLLEQDSESRIIEKAARERLGYVYPDEQVFVDISGSW